MTTIPPEAGIQVRLGVADVGGVQTGAEGVEWAGESVKKGAINPIPFLTGMVQSVIGYNTCFSFCWSMARQHGDYAEKALFEEVR